MNDHSRISLSLEKGDIVVYSMFILFFAIPHRISLFKKRFDVTKCAEHVFKMKNETLTVIFFFIRGWASYGIKIHGHKNTVCEEWLVALDETFPGFSNNMIKIGQLFVVQLDLVQLDLELTMKAREN